MMSARERQRLMERMDDDAPHTAAIVARCGAALCALVIIVVAGASAPGNGAANAAVELRILAQNMRPDRIGEHRRELFEQRRQKFTESRQRARYVDRTPDIAAVMPK